jgi:ABC-type polysaccharide/polyol phosphate export permease
MAEVVLERAAPAVVELDDRPDSRRLYLAHLRRHLDVLMILARKDFQTRYKRASLGITWAVVVPVLQGAIMAVVFSHVVRGATFSGYGAYVMGGMFAFFYFSSTLLVATTSIVDGSALTDKVWFPRVLLVIVPGLANLVSLGVTFTLLVALLSPLGGTYSPHLLLLLPAMALLIAFTMSLAMVLSALHVYFRDTKYVVQAALTVWMYVTPIIYLPTSSIVHRLAWVLNANPLTGIVDLVHVAALGASHGALLVPVAVSVGATLVLFLVGVEAQRRHDRLFVDLL